MKPSDQDRAKAEAENKHVYAVKVAAGEFEIEVICRRSKRVEWRRFLDVAAADPAKRYGATLTLFSQCLVWPAMRDLEPLFDEWPQVETLLASEFVGALQGDLEGDAKKLGAGSSGRAAI
jgi:hypothetical protein